jgi:hypothetical protein
MDRESVDKSYVAPFWKLEKEVRRRLIRSDIDGYLILACSKSAPETENSGWFHGRYHANAAATRDVIRVAEKRGWWKAEPDEEAATSSC